MRGIIILDGADCSGKTTLAEAIKSRAEALGAESEIIHLGKPVPSEAWQEHCDALLKYIELAFVQNKVVIADRHFMSESIYGRVYRNGSEYPFTARHMDRLLHRFRALRVICAPPVEYIVSKHEEMRKIRHEEYDEGMGKIADIYLQLWKGTEGQVLNFADDHRWSDYCARLVANGGVSDTLGWYTYDVTEHGKDLDTYARFLLNELNVEQDLMPPQLLNPQEYFFTGFPHSRAILLVGDYNTTPNIFNIPFLSNKDDSLFLAQILNGVNADESKLVIANIHDRNGVKTVSRLNQLCGHTIAVGKAAERALIYEGIRFDAKIPHPELFLNNNGSRSLFSDSVRNAFNKCGLNTGAE